MKPKPNTIQAIFPLASEGEINAVVRLIEEQVIGADEVRPESGPKRNGIEQGLRRTRNKLRAEQRTRLYALKGEK